MPYPGTGVVHLDSVLRSGERIVAMTTVKDRLFVATEHRVFELIEGVLTPLIFSYAPENEEQT